MSKQKIICISSCVVCVVASFLLGLFVGCNFCHNKKSFKPQKQIKFYSIKKNLDKKILQDEQKAVNIFVGEFEDCLVKTLEDNEKQTLESITKEVLDIAKENTKVAVNVKELKTPNAPIVVKKVRKCISKSKHHMTKTDKRLLNGGISKMKIDEMIKLFHGVK